jgi:hypothetical protein
MKENLQENNTKRLLFKELTGWYKYGKIPYKIFYSMECRKGSSLNEKNPGYWAITQDLGGGDSLSVYVFEDVPQEYKDIIMYHELTEAELVFVGGLQKKEAHSQAVIKTEIYAKSFLPKEAFEKFSEWLKTLDNY